MTRLVSLAFVAAACGSPSSTGPRVASPPAPRRGPACGAATLPALPDDLSARGSADVGARTVAFDELTVEVWYPAPRSNAPRARYDMREQMPASEAAKIPDDANAWLPCDCARDLPVDAAHGPYPVVLFLHGAASFRAQSAFLATHWASRGFIVIAPDLPGVGLDAALGGERGAPFGVPLQILDAIAAAPAGDDPLAFIRPRLDAGRVAVVGHSLGSMLAGTITGRPEVQVRIAMAGASGDSFDIASSLVLLGETDGIAPAAPARAAFTARPGARLAIVPGAGHLAFSDLCTVGADRGGALAIAQVHGVAVPEIVATLATDGCRPTDAPFTTTAPIIRALTSGVLEEALRCSDTATRQLAARPELVSP